MKILPALAALATAGGLLSLQVVAAIEASEGASTYTRASTIAACLVVAILPVFLHVAWRNKQRILSLALGVAFVSLLFYSLPAVVGRTGEIRETKVADASKSQADKARIEADHATTKRLVEEANRWQLNACKGGNGPDCKAATFVLNQRTASLEKLAGQLTTMKPAPAGDLGSEAWAWASGGTVSAETIRKASVLAFALGLDMAIWSLIALASSLLARKTQATVSTGVFRSSDLVIPADTTDEELEQLRKLLATAGRPLTNNEVAALMLCHKSEASKRVSKAIAAGMVSRRRIGREVSIALH